MNDTYNTQNNNNNNSAMKNGNNEQDTYKINNITPLAWTRHFTTLASNRSTHDSTFGNYSNYNKKMYNNRIAHNHVYNNMNNHSIMSSNRKE